MPGASPGSTTRPTRRSYPAGVSAEQPSSWREHPAADVVLALLVTATLLVGAYGEAHPVQPSDQLADGHPVPVPPSAAFLLVLLAGAVLVLRRTRPVVALVVSTAATAAYSLLGYVNGALLLAPVLALYAVASRTAARRAIGWAGGSLAVLSLATIARNPFGPTGGGLVLLPGLLAAALFAGIATNNRRALLVATREKAGEEALRQVDVERLRIARELHDVVAHTMATINVQAGAAVHVVGTRPDVAEETMRSIKAASKEGLRELRAILDVLRHAEDGDETAPTPGLGQLDTLVDGAARSGVATSVEITGPARDLPPEVDLAAYRIIQESLTNTIRHAGPARATICLRYQPDRLDLQISDDGHGPAAAAQGGFGLVGMRERATTVGGTLQTGARPDGGFQVAACLPLPQEAAT